MKNYINRLVIIIFVIISQMIISCATTPRFSYKPITNIPDDIAIIHFYNPYYFFGLNRPALILKGENREIVSKLYIGYSASVLIDPKTSLYISLLDSPNGSGRILPEVFRGGNEYFVQVAPIIGSKLVAYEKGKREIAKTHLMEGMLPIELQIADYMKKNQNTSVKIVHDDNSFKIQGEEILFISNESIEIFGNYHALIIGNNNYSNMPHLKTAISDANMLAEILQNDYMFNVKLLINATRTDILLAFNEYRKNLSITDNLLIYYAGHGWLDNEADEGYWLPIDADRDNSINWISNNTITSELRAMQAKHVMVISDSCYSGKLTRGLSIVNRTPDYLTRMATKRTRVVLSSGGLEPVMDSSYNSNNSVFAASLINILNENKTALDATTLFAQIRQSVMLNSDQTPEFGDIRKAGHDGGDFIFIPTSVLE